LTTRVYEDHCKREDILVKVAQKIRLDDFVFDISGSGWESVTPILEKSGALVRYDPGSNDYQADYQRLLMKIPNFDYYLYMGLDEGSMGFLDALAAGVPTIVTPQGFHLDIPGGIQYPFWDENQLAEVFRKIVATRNQRMELVSGLTWNEYARQHVMLWKAIISGEKTNYQDLLTSPRNPEIEIPVRSKEDIRRAEMDFYLKPFRRLWARITKPRKIS
jgi:hypothetical protein